MNKRYAQLLIIALLAGSTTAFAQESDSSKVTKPFFKKIVFSGVFQGRALLSLDKNVDVTGKHLSTGTPVTNSFNIKRARVQVKSELSDRLEAAILVNLAEFNDPNGKVLENAFVHYKLNRYFNVQVGQFRPAFGLEDGYPVDIIKSLDWSNQYTAFGQNGWQSFQIGLGIHGDMLTGKVPVTYSVAIVNGNNRNQQIDNDNGKLATTRFEITADKNLKFGISGGYGSVQKRDVYALGADVSTTVPLADKWKLEVQAEYKQGNNHRLFTSIVPDSRLGNMSRYQMRGAYVLPNLRYELGYSRLHSIEVSMRYEYFDEDFKHDGNVRTSYAPMMSFEFYKQYGARIQVGVQMDRYKYNIPDTKQYDANLMIVQLQTRF